MTDYRIKRIYESVDTSDGYRVLVDRLWPRGMSKQKARLDGWCKEIAPSHELRHWFNHDPERFEVFTVRYRAELATNAAVAKLLGAVNDRSVVTLLYSAHDELHNQAIVLQGYLQNSCSDSSVGV